MENPTAPPDEHDGPQRTDLTQSTAERIAQALGGRICGDGYLVPCPVADHGKGRGDQNPSLSIKDGDTQLLVKCWAGCCAEDILEALRSHGLPTNARPGNLGARRRARPFVVAKIVEPEPDGEAAHLWSTAYGLIGTPAERYLRDHRKISRLATHSLRYHPRVPYLGRGKRSATLMAAVRRSDGCVTAVQVTFLDDRCDKLSWGRARDNIGPLGAGAVRLFPPGEVLGLAEGVEDALSATQLTNIPCWAVLGAGRLGAVGLPSKVREVHLFADDDDPGRKGAANAREHFLRGGRTVVVRFPPEGAKDWNDVLRRHNV